MEPMEIARQLIRHMTANKNTLYVFCPYNIGDFLINGGLCHALLKKKRKQSCVLIERDRFANCGLNFVGVSEVQYIPQMLMDLIRQYICATGEYETDNYVYGHFHVRQDGFYDWNDDLSFVNRYKVDALDLPLYTELIPPLIEPSTDYQKQRLHADYLLDKKRTIILAPYANSTKNLEEAFWEKLASELVGKGYVLYTNVSNPREKAISGTSPMMTTFSELIYLAEKVNCFIGLRNGIFDLLALTNARIFYVIDHLYQWFYDLKINFNHLNSRPFYIVSVTEQVFIKDLMQKNNLVSIVNLIISNYYLRGKDVAFDGDTLLEKILGAVEQEGT